MKIKDEENLIFERIEEVGEKEYYILVIYDIISNKRRVKFAKLLKGYGFRVQKSSFEAYVSKRVFNKLLKEIEKFVNKTDTIRVYKILSKDQVYMFGNNEEIKHEEIIII